MFYIKLITDVTVIDETKSEEDPEEELMRAAGIGSPKVPANWQAIKRTNDFEEQQILTRKRIAEEMASHKGSKRISESTLQVKCDPRSHSWYFTP